MTSSWTELFSFNLTAFVHQLAVFLKSIVDIVMHEASLNFGGLTEIIVLDKQSFSENIGLNLVV